MIFFDTNVLVYAAITQDVNKQKISDRLIEEAVRDGTMTLSPLVISEFVFVLSKLKISRELIEAALALYEPFAKNAIDPSMVFEAAALCNELRQRIRLALAVQLYKTQKLTVEKTTQIAGISRLQFETALSENEIPISNLTAAEVMDDIAKRRPPYS